MLKRFITDGMFYSVGTLLSRGLSLVLIPILTRLLFEEDYGVLEIMAVSGRILIYIVSLEITHGVVRYLNDTDDPLTQKRYASTGLWFTVGVSGLLLVALECCTPWFSPLLLGDGWTSAYQLAAVSFAVMGVFEFLQNQLRWRLQPISFAITSIVNILLKAGVSITLIAGFRWGVEGVFMGMIVGDALGGALAWLLSREAYGLMFCRKMCWRMVKFSGPLVPSSIAAFMAVYIDRVVLRSIMGLDTVGLYGVASRIASSVCIVLVGFQTAIMPLIYSRHTDPETPAALARVLKYFMVFGLTVLLALTAFSKEVLVILTPAQYHGVDHLVPILSTALLLSGMLSFLPGLYIAKKTRLCSVIYVSTMLLNLLLNVLWIPVMGMLGAALATLLSATLCFLANMYVSQKYYPVPHSWRRIITGLLWIIPVGIGVRLLPGEINILWIVLKAGICLFTGTVLALILIEWEDLHKTVLSRLRRSTKR